MEDYQLEKNWERAHLIPELPIKDVEEIFSVCFDKPMQVVQIKPVSLYSMSNFNYRVVFNSHDVPLLLRLYGQPTKAQNEQYVIQSMPESLLTPTLLQTGSYGSTPFSIINWYDGIAIPELMPSLQPEQLMSLGKAIGAQLRTLHQLPHNQFPQFADNSGMHVNYWQLTIRYFQHEPCRHNLDAALKKRLFATYQHYQPVLESLSENPVCAHGDFKLANLLVSEKTCQLLGITDWELFCFGSRYADLGLLLRYPLPTTFVDAFLLEYQAQGFQLEDKWPTIAKLCDNLHLLGHMNSFIPKPTIFQDVRRLISLNLDTIENNPL